VPPSSGRSAALVGAGIFLSRVAGFIRQRVFSHYLGLYEQMDAVMGAFRIPNLLQNLFGEGALSASFIPVYARLVGQGEEERAGKVAGAVLGLLAFVVALIVLAGVFFTPIFVSVLVPGFTGHLRLLTISIVRVLFPATGLLVLSAWCLGILNSHRKFFVSYAAPVVWNAAIIVSTIWAALTPGRTLDSLAMWIAWAAVIGSFLQLAVQLPAVAMVIRGFRLSVRTTVPEVRTVVRNFWPALLGRGANQISAFVDGQIASFLGRGAVGALSNAQLVYTLPVSLFGMAVSAAELPAMSAEQGSDEVRHAALRQRLEDGLHRIAFFIVPCTVGFIALGQVVSAGAFQTGRFTAADSRYVWAILAGSSVGLLATTMGRLTSSTFFALGDTRTPLRYAALRVGLSIALGVFAALLLPPLLDIESRWGAVGLTMASGFAGWLEFLLLRRRLTGIIGLARLAPQYMVRLWAAALVAAGAGWTILLVADGRLGPLTAVAAVLGPYAAIYGMLTLVFRIPTAQAILARVRRRG